MNVRRSGILLLAFSMNALAACGSTGGSASSAVSPPVASASGATGSPAGDAPTPVASASAAFVPQLPAQGCCSVLALDAGRYALPGWLGPLLDIEVEDGWGLINDASARYLAFGSGENSVGTMSRTVTLLATPSGSTSADIVAALQGTSTLAFAGEPAKTTVGAFQAAILEARAKPNPDQPGDPGADIAAGTVDLEPLQAFVEPGFRLTTSTPEARLAFVVIDIDSRVVVAWLEAPAAEADAFFADAQTLLGTLERQAGTSS